jgi:NAD(P)-dependent dehydrogenase (short-subunit alcohol dehydrogenase family)
MADLITDDVRSARRGETMDLKLRDKVVLVTGAGQGLGRALGLAFATEGARVAFHYHSSAGGAEAGATEARALGVKAMAVGADLRADAAVADAVEGVERELGAIDVLVNNAAATQRKPFLESTSRDWAPQVDVTVTGTLRITHTVAGRMAKRGSGAIVNLMGDSGRVGESGLLVTATTRASAIGLTKSLARELARYGIRANCVSIALVQTDNLEAHAGGTDGERMKKLLALYPLRRLGRPEDVTAMVLLLASPLSSWTTGQVVSVNGGYAMV